MIYNAAENLCNHLDMGRVGHVEGTREWVVSGTPYLIKKKRPSSLITKGLILSFLFTATIFYVCASLMFTKSSATVGCQIRRSGKTSSLRRRKDGHL